MQSPERIGERLTALFLLGVVLFNPLVLSIFDNGAEHGVWGVPSLYLYVFIAWGVLIGLIALSARHLSADDDGPAEPDNGTEGPLRLDD